MASPQVNPASHRKLKTYGKASRHIPYAGSPSSSTLARPKAQELSRGASSKSAQPTENTRLQRSMEVDVRKYRETQKLNRAQPMSLSKLSRPSASRRISDHSQDVSVYDFSSSGDELGMDLGLHRKRRRIENTDPSWSREINERTQPRKVIPDTTRMDGRTTDTEEKKDSTPRSATKLPTCEVVIHASEAKSVTPSPLKGKDTRELAYRKPSSPATQPTSEITNNSQASSSSRLAKPLSSSREKPTAQTSALKRFEGLDSLHEEIIPTPPSKSPRPKALNGGSRTTPVRKLQKHDSMGSTATPSRRRLVDALNTQSFEESNQLRSSSPQERESESPDIIEPPVPTEANRNPRRRAITSSDNPPLVGPKVTYARQRSFLSVASQAGDIDPLLASTESLLGPSPAINGKGKSNTASSKDAFTLPDDEELGTGNGIRNIYELRRAGGNARFEGVIDSIFEDLEDSLSSRSGRWRALFQLCTRLTEYQFARRFLDNSLEKRLARFNAEKEDVICQYFVTSAFTLLLLTGQISSVALHTCCTQILELAPLLLPREDDISIIAKQQDTKISRMDRTALQNVRDKLQQSKIWEAAESPPPSTPQILALRCIDLVVRRVRETGGAMEIMSNTTLSQVVRLLLKCSAMGEVEDAETHSFSILEMSCSILESYTILGDALDQEKENIVRKLSKLGPLLSGLSIQSSSQGRQILILGIRLILNLTNNKPSLCDDFSKREIITALVRIVSSSFRMVAEDIGSDRKDSLLDTVILALGALINLTEWSAIPRKLVLVLRVDSGTFLDCLIHLFKDGLEAVSEADSVIQTHSNVAFGYLSVLLSTLSLDNDVRARVRSSLNGQGLHRLLETVNEFAQYHRKVEEELQDESMSGFTSRLQGIVDRIRRAESGH